MAIPIFGEIERLITEHGSAAILKERIALASDQHAALEKKLLDSELREENLRSENASLRLDLETALEKIRNLEEKLKREIERSNQFVESNGAFFKKNPNGGYHAAVYCPRCYSSAHQERDHGRALYICSCGWKSLFSNKVTCSIIDALSKS